MAKVQTLCVGARKFFPENLKPKPKKIPIPYQKNSQIDNTEIVIPRIFKKKMIIYVCVCVGNYFYVMILLDFFYTRNYFRYVN